MAATSREPRPRLGAVERFFGLIVVAVVFGAGYAVQAWREVDAVEPEATAPQAERAAPPFAFVDATEASGLQHKHDKLVLHPSLAQISDFITAIGGAAVSVVDFDGDGNQDVYFTTMAVGSPNRLFRNRGDGTFADVTESAGLAGVNRKAGSLRALFFDFDGDGDRDLVLTTTFCPEVYRNDGGRFTDVTAQAGIDHCGFAVASNAADFDRDGDLDLVIADFWKPVDLRDPDDYEFMPEGWYIANNGGPINLYRNDGKGRFSRIPGALGIRTTGFTHAVGVYDFDGDGGRDLYFADDFNYIDGLFLDDGNGGFRNASTQLAQDYSHSAMSAEIADFENSGHPAIFVSHVHAPGWVPSRNVLWERQPDGSFRDVARERGVDRCGWAWGAKFADLDNDGWQDLVVSNGFFTGAKPTSYWFPLSVMTSGHVAISRDARMWPPIGGRSMASKQRSCVYHNDAGKFSDVTAQTALADELLDGRGVAVIDDRNDGRLGILVANFGQPARFYRNEEPLGSSWVGFDVVGTRSGTDALGTRITVRTADGLVQTRDKQPANGYVSESDPRLHFGLGEGREVTEVEVRWPSGAVQKLTDLEPGRYHRLLEPEDDADAR